MDVKSTRVVGAQCGVHGSSTFYKAIKFYKNDKYKILTLGEFFYLKIMTDIPLCCGELQMIWTNKQDDNQLLCSVRLYFLPEHTPLGKLDTHGEDEILAVAEKMVLRADDLVPLIADHVEWTRGRKLYVDKDIKEGDPQEEKFRYDFSLNNRGLNLADVELEKKAIGDEGNTTSTQLIILSFPQYCRYRAVLRRLEPMEDKWLKNAIVCAIGGITSLTHNNRIMYCKNLVDFPDLEDLEWRCDHLAPSLRGRRRKTKEKTENKSDSDSYETSSDISISPSVKMGKRDSVLRNNLKFDRNDVSTEEQEFLINLHSFMKKRSTPIVRIPSLGFKQIDLFFFYTCAKKLGGYEMVTQKRQWRHLYDKLGGNPNSTSAATFTRRHYEKLLLPFERHEKGKKIEKKSGKIKEEKEGNDLPENKKISKPLGRPPLDSKQKARFKTTLTLKERALQWQQLRKLKEHEKAGKVKGFPGRPRTVKHLLDKSEKEKLSAAITNSMKVKVENGERGSKDTESAKLLDIPNVDKHLNLNNSSSKCSDNEATHNGSANLFSQSKLFKHEPVQSNFSANYEKLHENLKDGALSGLSMHASPAAMFYPQTFLPVHPLGLPIMPQVPLGVPPFLHAASSLSDKHQSFRPNILRTSSNHKTSNLRDRSPSSIHQKHKDMTSYLSPSQLTLNTSHAHSRSHSESVQSQNALMVPPAHSHGSKRSYMQSHSHIPSSHSKTNKSLLFDFESPKRPKLEGSVSTKSGMSEDQPTDYSMKTLRKLQFDDSDRELGEITRNSLLKDSKSPLSVQHSKETTSLSLPVFPSNSIGNVFKGSNSSIPSPHTASASPYPSEKSKSTSKCSTSTAKVSDSKCATAKAESLESPAGIVHPAFMHAYMRPPVPHSTFFSNPLQMQQLYEAHMRAGQTFNGLQGIIPDPGMIPRFPMPMFLPQVPLYTHSQKDKK